MALSCTHIFMQLVSHKILSLSKQYNCKGPACSAYLLHGNEILVNNPFMVLESILVLYAK